MNYHVYNGSIIDLASQVQCIVNSANPYMTRGGGVCGAIHEAAGEEFTRYCMSVGGFNHIFETKVTPGFNLRCEYVFHILAPQYKFKNPIEHLEECYKHLVGMINSFEIKSVAIPLLSAGHYGFPVPLTCQIAHDTLSKLNTEATVYLVCYTKEEQKEMELIRQDHH